MHDASTRRSLDELGERLSEHSITVVEPSALLILENMSTSSSTLKARHYAALAVSLRHLQQDLSESELQMVRLTDHLESMQKMGTYSAAQFMAVSRLLDKELNDEEEKRVAEEVAEASQAQR